jgi:hypothetical protein
MLLSRWISGGWVWSCIHSLSEVSASIYLGAKLMTDTPWDEPSETSPEFAAYLSGQLLQYDPWTRIRGPAQSM